MTRLMLLQPRELELVLKPANGTENGVLLSTIQRRVDRISGELELSEQMMSQVTLASKRWKMGHEKAFLAILNAAKRHTGC